MPNSMGLSKAFLPPPIESPNHVNERKAFSTSFVPPLMHRFVLLVVVGWTPTFIHQRVTTSVLVHLISLLCSQQPAFAESMRRVVRAVEASAQTAIPPLPLGGVVFSLGGIKKCPRIIEKIILDPRNPTAKPALDSLEPNGLDASGILDIVRGMFICASMRHAVAVIEALRVSAETGHFELVSGFYWPNLISLCHR